MDSTRKNTPGGQRGELLNISDLHVEYRTIEGVVHAVNGLNLTIREGESLGLVGETGAGKTTTALSIMQLVASPPGVRTKGSVVYQGCDLTRLPDRELQKLRGNQISMIFQNPMASLDPVQTIGSQIIEVLQKHQSLSKREARKKAGEMLRLVGILDGRMDEYPYEFSGGMQQRVSIAIALACQPKLLIADEPTTALDVTIQAQVLALMKDLKKGFDSSLLLITHDFGLVAEICDIVAVMYAGIIVESGTLIHIFNHTMHPYTEGLFNSIPKLNETVSRLKPIAGLSPDPKNLPSGCPFHPRCPYAMAQCASGLPPVWERDGHMVRCWKYAEREVVYA